MRSAMVLLLTVVVACFGVWVDGDSSYIGVGAGPEGMFSIGLPPDPPLWPDVRPILHSNYRAESPDGAYFNLYIDGKIYSNTHLISMIYPDSAAN
ncbi:hypothetical protein J7L01_02610, partial [bacterium]|nr:hypothetical protein [bacterium]